MPVYHDTAHPNGIFYHVLSAQRIALSYLAAPPRSASSPAVLASFELPEHIDESQTPAQLAQAHADVMEENAAFRQLMHGVLKGAAADDGMLQYEAYLRKSGFAHVAGGCGRAKCCMLRCSRSRRPARAADARPHPQSREHPRHDRL